MTDNEFLENIADKLGDVVYYMHKVNNALERIADNLSADTEIVGEDIDINKIVEELRTLPERYPELKGKKKTAD